MNYTNAVAAALTGCVDLPIEELEARLRESDRQAAAARLSSVSVGDYIHGMTAEELLSQIFTRE